MNAPERPTSGSRPTRGAASGSGGSRRPLPLVIAAHGTRVPEGQAACRALVARVAALLPDVDVRDGYVELDTPSVADAVAAALAGGAGRVVVVPLMLGAGGHVHDDIPAAGEEGRARVPGSKVTYAAHLGAAPGLRAALGRRAAAAASGGGASGGAASGGGASGGGASGGGASGGGASGGELAAWEAADVALVVLGRGCSVTEANADHVRLARQVGEEGGYGLSVPAFIQVVRPTLRDGLDQAYAVGFRRIVVAPNFLFPGRLHGWTSRGIDAWTADHPDAEVRLADVIGDCDELAAVVVERYRRAAGTESDAGAPVYLAGLALRGRRVVVVGAGAVATRRLGRFVEAGADVLVVAPDATPGVRSLAAEGRLTWQQRTFAEADLEGAWYVLALTDSPAVNAAVAAGAEARHTFCVRGDDARGGSAWTPASGAVAGLSVGVVGDRDPRRSAAARDVAVAAVAAWASGEEADAGAAD